MLDDPKFIAACVLLVTNLAGLIKLWGDLAKQRADRIETKAARDKELFVAMSDIAMAFADRGRKAEKPKRRIKT